MGQRYEGRLTRLKWLGDMEPEYEDFLEWMNLGNVVGDIPEEERSALHWAVIADSMAKVSGGLSGVPERQYSQFKPKLDTITSSMV